MKYPVHVIQEISQRTNVSAVEMLGYLLQMIRGSHRLYAGVFADDPKRQRDVFDDIRGRIKHAGREADPPKSLLALLDLIVESDQAGTQFLVDEPANAFRKQLLEKYKADLDALRLVLRELMNDAEHDGIETIVEMEERFGPIDKRFGPDGLINP